MARGTQLQQLIYMLRAECGHSTNVSAGVDNTPALTTKLARTQQMLYDDYDWPMMSDDFPIALQSGQRYYDFPSKTLPGDSSTTYLDMEAIEKATINYSGRPAPVDRGIDWEQYAQYNSDNGDRASPMRRWDIRRTSAAKEQLEVWPVPTDSTQIFNLRGKLRLRPLIAMSDVADIDDLAIVLTVASEILARAGAKDAGKVEAAAAARLKQLKVRVKGGTRRINMAGSGRYNHNRGKTIIRIGSQSN